MIPIGLLLANLCVIFLIIMMMSRVDIWKPFRLLFAKQEEVK